MFVLKATRDQEVKVMYCINCGIELSKGQAVCPICGTKVNHPEFIPDPDLFTYPVNPFRSEAYNIHGLMFVLTMFSLLMAALPLLLEGVLTHRIRWSGYVSCGTVLVYILFLLPLWFQNPNPVIFLPVDFLALGGYLLFIERVTNGGWFLTFAMPIVLLLAAINTAVVALIRYLRRGRLFIYGGGLIAYGGFMMALEYFISITFGVRFIFWSLFPLAAFVFMGLTLITVAIVKPFKESLKRYFYI